jgi:hypothetical protein
MYVLGAAAFAAGVLYLAYGDYLLGAVLVVAVGGTFTRLLIVSRREEPHRAIDSRRAVLVRSLAFAALGIACILVGVFAYMPTFALRVVSVTVGVLAIFLSIRNYGTDRGSAAGVD